MKRKALPRLPLFLAVILAFTHASHAQFIASPMADASSSQAISNHTFSFSGTIPGQLDGALSVTFSIYPDQQSASALWTETQVVQVTSEKYTVMLGSTSPTGLPSDIFSADHAHWLGVQLNGSEKRFLLVSVPYAMKAVEAERLGGLLPSDFVTVQQLQSALQSAATPGTPTPTKTTASGPTGQAAAAGTPPQPATDFTDNNASEILLVTQQGTGFAIHAISSGDAAIFAENSTSTGTALKVLESSSTGLTVGVLAQTSSPEGIPGVFDNTSGQGAILRLQSNGNIVTTFNHLGDINTIGEILAGRFNGDGSGLFNIPPAAINATPGAFPNSVVARDASGGFSGNQIFANTFSGSGAGLTDIPPAAINATPGTFPNSVVARDASGSFNANQIFANMFSGSGAGLFNVPTSALNASTTPIANSLVLRDNGGGLSAGTVFASNLLVNAFNGTAIQGSATGNAVGIQASTQNGFGLWAGATANDSTGTALLLSHASQGKLISGGVGSDTNVFETFSVGAGGDVSFSGAMMTPYETTGTWFASSLVKLTSIPGNFGAGTVALTSPGDTSGAIGIISGVPASGFRVQVVQSGQFFCNFDGPATSGHYVGISKITAGDCADIGASYPTDGQQVVGRVLSSFTAGIGRVLLFQSELHGAAGGGGSVTINTGAGLTGGPITSSGTISVADGGITAAKLAPNAVTSASIADNSMPPAKITGTAATLGSNTFLADQTIQTNLTVKGTLFNTLGIRTSNLFVSESNPSSITQLGSGPALVVAGGSTGISISGSGTAISATADFGTTVIAQNTTSTAIAGIGSVGVDAVTATGVGLQARTTGANGIAATFTNASTGKLISGRVGLSNPVENFSVDTAGNVFAAGAHITQVRNNASVGTALNLLARLASDGSAVRAADFVDKTGIIGIVVGGAGFSGNAQIAFGGIANCGFITATQAGDYVEISGNGFCGDVGATYPVSGQVIGRVLASSTITDAVLPVLLYGPEQRALSGGSVTSINTGAGLTGGPITGSGTISITNGGVTNAMLQNSSVSVTTGAGLSGGGVVPLGGSVALSNTGALSFNGRAGNVLPAQGDYSFSQLNGIVSPAQLPPSVVYNNQGNGFSGRQVVTGTVGVNDFSASGGSEALGVFSQNNVAGFFTSNGPIVLAAANTTGGLMSLSGTGVLTVTGNVFGSSFIGDGSRLTNVNAASVGGVAVANLATTSALGAETTARQSGDTTLQSNINAESTARASADTTLQNNINAETATRASADASLQTNINSLSSAAAQLAAANTFTAKQTLAASTTTSASLNVPGGSAPATPAAGDVWNTGNTLQYRDNASTTRSLVSTTQSGGLQMLKLTASINPANVGSQACAEQSFTVSGISTGDVLLSVLQPSTSSPGTNIAIGGFRVSSVNTVAVQFCNVSRNNSTPTAGVYTFAFMR